jgi:CxxC-x17-CxxC domain-containing protein
MGYQDRGNKGGSGNRGGNKSGGRSGGGSFGGGNRGGGFRRDNFNSAPREMHKATCAECKKECEVPFKPSQDRPVYCRDCFSKHKKF